MRAAAELNQTQSPNHIAHVDGPANDTAVQRRTHEGAQRPRRPSDCNGQLDGAALLEVFPRTVAMRMKLDQRKHDGPERDTASGARLASLRNGDPAAWAEEVATGKVWRGQRAPGRAAVGFAKPATKIDGELKLAARTAKPAFRILLQHRVALWAIHLCPANDLGIQRRTTEGAQRPRCSSAAMPGWAASTMIFKIGLPSCPRDSLDPASRRRQQQWTRRKRHCTWPLCTPGRNGSRTCR
jgi:hypothetical protein